MLPADDVDAIDLENPLLPVNIAANGIVTFPPVAAFPFAALRPGGYNVTFWFSLDPASASAHAVLPADVLFGTGDSNTPLDVIEGTSLGLQQGFDTCEPPACDDIDAFFIDHLGQERFSLAAGSPTLATIPATAADILQSNPGGLPKIYVSAADLGLDPQTADVDALDVETCRFTVRERFRLKNFGRIMAGTYVEVTDPQGDIHLGRDVYAEDGSVLVADRVKLDAGTSVANVSSDSVRSAQATIRGVTRTTTPRPIPVDYTVRTAATCTGPAITVPPGQTLILDAGRYGDVRIGEGATLILKVGVSRFCSLTMDDRALLEFEGLVNQSPAMSRLEIAGDVRLATSVIIRPAYGTPVPQIEVGGRRFGFGQRSEVYAFVRAPRAHVRLHKNSTLRGSLVAARVSSDHTSRIGCAQELGYPEG